MKRMNVDVTFPSSARNAKFITVDEITSFSKVKGQYSSARKTFNEQQIKNAFKKIINEQGSFKDWGGEKSDLYTTRVRIKNGRVSAAIAFKGGGTKGKLVPSKMGKNGDQINRLFDEPAQLYLVVYYDQIDPSIISQMKAFATAIAIGGQKVYFGVIDGSDLSRLVSAYPECF